jgi:predicted flavoprotein YhiN
VVEVGRPNSFRVETNQGPFKSSSLVLATGGLSIPKLGATGFTHDVAQRFCLRLTELRPGLVPLTFSDELLALMRSLTGVSLDSAVALGRHRFHEAMLFTHRGLSGPAILQISSYWQRGRSR